VAEAIFGRYRLVRQLGAGGGGEVHEAVDLSAAGRAVALKIAPRGDVVAADALLSEFRLLRRLHAEAIPRALDFGTVDARAFLARTLAAGEPLDLRRRRWTELAPLVRSLLVAVRHLHVRGLVHGDLKAANVLTDGTRVALIDLGLASEAGRPRPIAGTPGHLAPEVLAGAPKGQASDLYALAVMLERVLEGPVPAHVKETLGRARRPDPAERPADADALWESLRGADGDLQPLGGDPPSAELPLVGRADLLAGLVDDLSRSGVALAVTGPEGIGKSRLVREAGWTLQSRGVRFASVSAREGLAALRAAAGLGATAADEDASPSGVALRIALAASADRAASSPRGGAVIHVDDLDAATPEMLQTLRALVGLVSSGEPDGPDRPDREVRPLSIVLSGSPAAWTEGLRRIEVGDLGETDADALLAAGGVPSPQSRGELRALAGASPGPLIDAIRGVGTGLDNAVQDRIRRLPASVQGDVLALAFASGSLPIARLRALETLEENGLVEPAGAGRLRLSNTRMGEVLLRSERPAAAAAARDRLGGGLPGSEDRSPADDRVLADALAALGDPQAAEARLHAAEALLGVDPGAAADVAGALDSPRALEIRIRGSLAAGRVTAAADAARLPAAPALAASAALLRAGDDAGASAALDRAVAEAASNEDRAVAHLERARLAARRGRLAESLAEADLGLAAGPTRAATGAALGLARGHALGSLGQGAQALTAADAALAISQQVADARGVARAENHRAIALQRLGRRGEALDAHRRAAAAAEAAGLAREGGLATYVLNLGAALYYLRRLEEAERESLRALRLARLAGRVATETGARLNLAAVYLERGQVDRADEQVRSVATAESSRPQGVVAVAARILEGDVLRARGDAAAADARFEAAQALHRAAGRPREAAEATLRRVGLALDSGRIDAARGLLLELGDESGLGDQAEVALLCRGRLARQAGEDPRPILGDLAASEQPDVACEAAHETGLWLRAQGDPSAAKEAFARAAQTLVRIAAELPAFVQESFWSVGRRWAIREAGSAPALAVRAVLPAETPAGLDKAFRLLALNARIAGEHDFDRLLDAAMDTAIDVLEAERGFLLVRIDEELEVRVARNIDREAIQGAQLKWSRRIAEEVFRSRELLVTTDAMADDRLAESASVHSMRLRSILCVPVLAAERAEGVLYIDNRFRTGAFGESDVRLARALADQLAVALVNARLIRELRARTEDLEVARAHLEELFEAERARGRTTQSLLARARRDLQGRFGRGELVGRGSAMRRVFERIDRVVDATVTVLLTGESGTGKELVARAIHLGGLRKDGPFVALNCGAVPETLLESELFGHVKGAFTGAVASKDGLFVAADCGTLLLDEVSDMPPAMQVRLLRVLQDGEVRPVGAAAAKKVDVRVIAATQRPLEDLVRAGLFREDLFYRLRVVGIEIPPLRDRGEDLPALVEHFLARSSKTRGRRMRVSDEAMRALVSYPWPGNVRELQNVLERACVLARGIEIGVEDLGLATPPASSVVSSAGPAGPEGRSGRRDHLDAEEVRRALAAERGHKGRAAKRLGVSRVTLYRRMKDLGIE